MVGNIQSLLVLLSGGRNSGLFLGRYESKGGEKKRVVVVRPLGKIFPILLQRCTLPGRIETILYRQVEFFCSHSSPPHSGRIQI